MPPRWRDGEGALHDVDFQALQYRFVIDGEQRQQADTRLMLFPVARLLSEISHIFTLHIDFHLSRLNLICRKNLLQCVDRPNRHFARLKPPNDVRHRKFRKLRLVFRNQRFAIEDTVCIDGVVALCQIRTPQKFAEAGILAVIANCDQNIAIGCLKDLIGHNGRMFIAAPWARLFGRQVSCTFVDQPAHLAVHQRHVDMPYACKLRKIVNLVSYSGLVLVPQK